jgi:predicted RNA-binding Zn-ribbon protein involved in translation (DUF1610 family)
MAKETQTATGQCPTHGSVEATRDIPRVTFPPIITAISRARAKRKPYQCPECGADVEVS